MRIRNVIEDMTCWADYKANRNKKRTVFTEQFHCSPQKNARKSNNVTQKSFPRGNWSWSSGMQVCAVRQWNVQLQFLLLFCSLMCIHDMQFLALWTTTGIATRSFTRSTSLLLEVARRSRWRALHCIAVALYQRKQHLLDCALFLHWSHSFTFTVRINLLW
jgi:hypothetical protein